MPRNYVYAIIGAVAFSMIFAGAYGLINNHLMQANSDPVGSINYSGQFGSLDSRVSSLQSQMDSMKDQLTSLHSDIQSIDNNITTLESLKRNMADIDSKLSGLQKLDSNIADIQNVLTVMGNNSYMAGPVSNDVSVSLDKQDYQPGDIVHISATGVEPLKPVKVQLLDSDGAIVSSKNTWADSTGSILYDLKLTSDILPGQYAVKIYSPKDYGAQSIKIIPVTPANGNLPVLTAQTDKGLYQGGDLVKVTGVAFPDSYVTLVMKSSSGTVLNSDTTSNSDGSYSIFLPTSTNIESGTWTLTVADLSQTKTLSVYIQSNEPASSAFTAQLDKSAYDPGDLIRITGTAQPSSEVTAVLTSPSQSTYSSSTNANSDGSYTLIFPTTSFQEGNWTVNVDNLGQSKVMTVIMGSSAVTAYPFTAQTDMASYSRGDLIQVAGNARSGSTVSAVMVSPAGTTYDTNAISNSNGNYVLFFSTTASYSVGKWFVEVSNSGQTKILSFMLQ